MRESDSDFILAKLDQPTHLGLKVHRYFGKSWCMHLPFAYELMRELKPRIFVELGVWKGESYFTFCQSVEENKLTTRCYGVDTWQGDIHMGVFPPEIGRDTAKYNQRYARFSELKAMPFDQAVSSFADGSIDLLHIDGGHRYEDVKTDFENWLPKVSEGGIILFHDVTVHKPDFGVWRFWEEVARAGQSFLFEFGHGLGVWKKGPVLPTDPALLQKLFLADQDGRKAIMDCYANAGCLLYFSKKLDEAQGEINRLKAVVKSATEWQRRLWITRAFHRWRDPGMSGKRSGFLLRIERSLKKRCKFPGSK